MAECECFSGCPFVNGRMETKPALAKLMKTKYCMGDNSACARHQIKEALGSAAVPADLYPHQVERVAEILRSPGPSKPSAGPIHRPRA